jgi:hypothetical protein
MQRICSKLYNFARCKVKQINKYDKNNKTTIRAGCHADADCLQQGR